MAQVSVVIPARDEGDWVRRTVEAVAATSQPHQVEVVVVDDGSTDGSCDFLRTAVPGFGRVVDGPRRGVSAARNVGAMAARGDLLFFLDAHVIPDSGWLDELCSVLGDPSVAIVGPAVKSYENPSSIGYAHRVIDENLANGWGPRKSTAPFDVPSIVGCGQGYRRSFFVDAGMFDPGNVGWGVEDVEISLRAWLMGFRCVCCPNSVVAHCFKAASDRQTSVSWADYDTNLVRCLLTCFTGPRLRAIITGCRSRATFAAALESVTRDGSFWRWRNQVCARFARDDAWYVAHFSEELAAFRARLDALAAPDPSPTPRGGPPVVCGQCGLHNLGPMRACVRCGSPLAPPRPPAPKVRQHACRVCGGATQAGLDICEPCAAARSRPAAPPPQPPPARCGNTACGAELKPGKRFCTKCGTPVA